MKTQQILHLLRLQWTGRAASARTGAVTILLPLILVSGCSSTATTADQKDAVRKEVYQQWQACRDVYLQSPTAYWVSQGHTSRVAEWGSRMPHISDMRRDLVANLCGPILLQ